MKYLCAIAATVLLFAASPLRAQTPRPHPSTPSVGASNHHRGPNSYPQRNWSNDRGNQGRNAGRQRDSYRRDDRGHPAPDFDVWLVLPQWRWWLRWRLFPTRNYQRAHGERRDRRDRC